MIIDPEVQAAWIAERTGLDVDVVSVVLDVEMEYMATIGIATPPLDYEFQWYQRDPDRLPGRKGYDYDVIAKDCERLAQIPEGVARAVLEAEMEFMGMGLA